MPWRIAPLLLWMLASPAVGAEPVTEPGRPATIRGEVVSISCFLIQGLRGQAHVDCARESLARGGQLAILDEASGRLHPSAGHTPGSDPSAYLRGHLAHRVSASGRVFERAGVTLIVIERVERLR